ncbi:MAG: hypothetical protein ACRDHZ_05805 [Ktedonobacteraceae bacterium]
MKRNFLAFSLLLCLSILLLAGCGYNGTAPTLTGSTITLTAISAVTPGTTVTSAASTSPTPGSHTSGVTVQLSASGYHTQDTIVVTISNGTAQTISFADHQSNCTIALLQHQNAANWDSVNICRLMTLTRLLTLQADQSTTVTLHTSSTAWQVGTYRVAFSYSTGADGDHGAAAVAYSPVFQIQ